MEGVVLGSNVGCQLFGYAETSISTGLGIPTVQQSFNHMVFSGPLGIMGETARATRTFQCLGWEWKTLALD